MGKTGSADQDVRDGTAEDSGTADSAGDPADEAKTAAGQDAGEIEDELFEIEVDEDDIYAYLVDEDDNEIGFVLIEEDGTEQEYYYADDVDVEDVEEVEDPKESEQTKGRFSNETYEAVGEMTNDVNAIYKEGKDVASELKGAVDDITSGFDFFKPSKNRS